jgi:hypothetical protein
MRCTTILYFTRAVMYYIYPYLFSFRVSIDTHLVQEVLAHTPFTGNNTGACSLKHLLVVYRLRSFALLVAHLMQFTWCLRNLGSQA